MEPPTSPSGVRDSTARPTRAPHVKTYGNVTQKMFFSSDSSHLEKNVHVF